MFEIVLLIAVFVIVALELGNYAKLRRIEKLIKKDE